MDSQCESSTVKVVQQRPFEIIFVVIPITVPVLWIMGVDPVWLGVMIGLLLQTSFLAPPSGFSLFYLRGVAPRTIRLMAGMGMGIAFLPALYTRSAVGPDDRDVAMVSLAVPRILPSVGLVTRTGGAGDAAARIAGVIRSVAREVFAGTPVHDGG